MSHSEMSMKKDSLFMFGQSEILLGLVILEGTGGDRTGTDEHAQTPLKLSVMTGNMRICIHECCMPLNYSKLGV